MSLGQLLLIPNEYGARGKRTYFLQRLQFELDGVPKLSDLNRLLILALHEEGSEGLEFVEQGVAVA